MKLSIKIPVLIFSAALAAGLGTSVFGYLSASQALHRAAEQRLMEQLDARVQALSAYQQLVQDDLLTLAESPFLARALPGLYEVWARFGRSHEAQMHEMAGVASTGIAPDLANYGGFETSYDQELRHWMIRRGYRSLALLDRDGHVLYAVQKNSETAGTAEAVPGMAKGIDAALRAAVAEVPEAEPAFVDFALRDPADGSPSAFVSMKILDDPVHPATVLLLQLSSTHIDEILRDAPTLGQTGQSLIVGADLRLRGASQPTLYQASLQSGLLGAITRALNGESGVAVASDPEHDGLVAFRPVGFFGAPWAAAARIDVDEALAPLAAARNQAIAAGAAVAFLVAILCSVAAWIFILRPLNLLIRAGQLLAGGGHRAPLSLRPRNDEIGELGKTLALFREFMIERESSNSSLQSDVQMLESSRRFRIISDALAVAVLVVDIRDGTIRYANPAALSLFAMATADGPIYASANDLMVGPEQLQGMIAVALEGKIHRQQTRLRRLDGSVFPVNLSARFLEIDGARCIVISVVDLSDQQDAQAEIERQREKIHQTEKLGALGSLLAGVAHELNNPLSIVVAQSTLLEESAEDPKTISRGKKIRAAAERCARIVKTFLAMARQRPPSRAAVDINRVVGAAIEITEYGLKTAGITLTASLAPDLPSVWADPDQIGQVVTNLIVNAQQAMADWEGPRRLTIETRLEAAEHMLRIAVTDSGPGIPPEIKSRIFDPFFTTKPVGVGTGIGLSVSFGIVASHNGNLLLEDSPDGGARFVVRLPIGTMPRADAEAAPAPERRAAGQSLLIVDDEPEVAETLAEILSSAGYKIEIAEGGRAALDRLRTTDFDAVLSDIRMPDVNGPTLYRRLKEMKPRLAERLILVTGDTLSQSVQEFLDSSDLPCLEKPFDLAEVRRIIAAVIAGEPTTNRRKAKAARQ